MEWIADRFFKTHDGWIDAATGDTVGLHISPPHPPSDLDWNEQCARLANLRHPLLNPLLDYGLVVTHRFEAYAAGPAVTLSSRAAGAALEHVAQFVRAAGVELQAGRCGLAMRAAAPATEENTGETRDATEENTGETQKTATEENTGETQKTAAGRSVVRCSRVAR